MTWLTPLAGVILAAAVIPPLIVLYFLKLRRRPQAISTTLLWKKSIEDLRANAPFQKLRKSLLLLLQLIALALLAFSVMQPQIRAGQQQGGKTIIMIDNSASMTASDTAATGDATRLDEAKRRAREKIESLYGGGLFASSSGESMVVVFSDRAEIYSRFSDSKQQLLSAIDRIQPTHGETKIAEALKLARAYTTNVNPDQKDRPIADPATVELYSDGRISDTADQVLRGETLNYHAIGKLEADNVAIGSISVERPYDRPNAVEVFVSLLNYNQSQVKCQIQLSVDDRARGIEETTIDAAQINPSTKQIQPGRANVVFTPFDEPRGAVIEVANLRQDDLAADNVARVVVAAPTRLVVALVTANAGRSIVLKALEGMKFERLEQMSPEHYEALASKGELESYDVIVVDNYKPVAMPTGRYLTFGPTPPIDGLTEFGDGQQQIILSGKDEHPALRYVTHDSLFISKFKLIQPGPDVQVLLEGSRGPAILAISRGPMQIIHCAFDPLESNWPFQHGFVNFLFNAVDFLGHAGEAITTQGLAPGEALTARLPPSATNIQLLTPGNATPEDLKPLDPAQLAWGPIKLAGLYRLTWKGSESEQVQNRAFAVNLLSESEGWISMNDKLEIGQEKVQARDRDESVYTPLWPWAIGVCLAVLMLEWWVYHRKAYI